MRRIGISALTANGAPAKHDRSLLGYRFVARGPELRIEHEFVEPIVVRVEPFGFALQPPSPARASLRPQAEPREPVRFDLTDAHGVADQVHRAIAARWERRFALPPLPILHGHLIAARTRALRDVNPEAHGVTRALCGMADTVPLVACDPAFYAEPYLARDVIRYRAAACAVAYLETVLYEPWCRQRGIPAETSVTAQLSALRNWRSLFSPTGRAYRSLNRTLDGLGPAVPTELVPHLRRFVLESALLDPVQLTAVLIHVSDSRGPRLAEASTHGRRALERAAPDEIREAVAAIGTFTGRPLDAERPTDLGFTVRFLIDYPHPYQGRLPGLVRRTIRWHEEIRAANRREREREPERHPAPRPPPDPPRRLGWRPASPPTARPRIPLPETEGVTFLSTAEQIRAEGRRMDNCIASYVNAAVAGRCYLFHIEHGEQEASVEVDPLGHVRQAEGPANSVNEASDWGARVLRDWGKRLRAAPSPIRRMSPARPRRLGDPRQLPLTAADPAPSSTLPGGLRNEPGPARMRP